MQATRKKASCKPVHLELRDGKSNRQRLWESLRAAPDGITPYRLHVECNVTPCATRDYLRALERAGYLERLDTPCATTGERPVRLVRRGGSDAPALTRDGKPSRQGVGVKAIWRALRIVGEASAVELSALASAAVPTAESTVTRYMAWLVRAGYVVVKRSGNSIRRYRLLPHRYSGPRPPVVQRTGGTARVYDANLDRIVWEREAK